MACQIVIVGASVAGIRTAQALRTLGESRPIVILERDEELPCDRPPLSKGFLAGDVEAHPLLTLEAARDLSITVELGAEATGLDLGGAVLTRDGSRAFEDLIIATGADARRGPWLLPSCAHVLRTQADAGALRSALASASSLAIIGGGFIGSEVAATTARSGIAVTIIDAEPIPLARVAGAEVARHFIDNLTVLGVEFRLGAAVEDVVESSSTGAVLLEGGERVDADVILIGIGAAEQTAWLLQSGLDVTDGVACNQFGQVVGHDHIWAVGDVAKWPDPATSAGHRAEHWTAAVNQANVVAHNIVNRDAPIRSDAVPYVWSDQGGWKIQLAGSPGPDAEMTTIGTPGDDRGYAAVYAVHDRVCGVITINWPRAMLQARRALAERPPVSVFSDLLRSIQKPS